MSSFESMRASDLRRARTAAVQMLYMLDAQQGFDRVAELLPLYLDSLSRDAVPGLNHAGRRLATDLCRETVAHLEEVDASLREAATRWRLERMDRVDRSVLRLAAHELLAVDGPPPAVVINEAVELAKTLGTEHSGSFVNGVLSGVIRAIQTPDTGV